MKLKPVVLVAVLPLAVACFAQQSAPEPVIDMHMHAMKIDEFSGPLPQRICAPCDSWPAWDPQTRTFGNTAAAGNRPAEKQLLSPMTSDELMTETLGILKKFNITAVAVGTTAPGSLETVDRWKRAGGEAIIPAASFSPAGPSPAELRKWAKEGRVAAFAEILTQYEGITPDSQLLEPYFALAEELDIPVGIHMGPGPPGAPYLGSKGYRAKLSSLLLLEDVLVRHPKLRVWAMHAGWPLADDAIAALYTHPQLYVDIGVIDYIVPRAEFYAYLRKLIDAGFENRIMFGSDQMIWPQAIPAAIETIRSAPFLTEAQKRDILYNNAARFLRLKK